MYIKLKSLKTKSLKKKDIEEICKLKNKEWKYGLKSQLNFFEKNYHKLDIHNLIYFKKKLIGYTALRKRLYGIRNNFKKYLLFDTLIIDSKFRKKKLSFELMNFNNKVIKKNKKFSFLICKSKMIKFYKKFDWVMLNKNNIRIEDHKFNSNGMIYNYHGRNIKDKKIKFYFN